MRTPLPPNAHPTGNVASSKQTADELAASIAGHLPVFAKAKLDKLIAAIRDETIRQIADCRATQSTGAEIGYCSVCGNHQRMDRKCAAKQMQEYPRPTVAFAELREKFGDLFDEAYPDAMSTATGGGKTHTAAYLCERMSAPAAPAAMELEEALAAYAADSIAAELAEIDRHV